MSNYENISIFNKYKTILKKTSYDKTNKIYMTDSSIEVVDFDKVKEEYCSPLKLNEPPKSCDALYLKENKVFLIEFKNGIVNTFDVRKKIYDSILLFTDLTNCGISQTRKDIEYILVYDREKNSKNKECKEFPKKNIQSSESFENFTAQISKLA